MDSLAMFFGAKKRAAKKSSSKRPASKRRVAKRPVAKRPVAKKSATTSVGSIVVRGRERKVYRGRKGGLYYRSKGAKVYVDSKTVSRHHRGDARRKTHRLSPQRRRRPAKKVGRKTKYGYGLGQPTLTDMMGPANLMSFGGYY